MGQLLSLDEVVALERGGTCWCWYWGSYEHGPSPFASLARKRGYDVTFDSNQWEEPRRSWVIRDFGSLPYNIAPPHRDGAMRIFADVCAHFYHPSVHHTFELGRVLGNAVFTMPYLIAVQMAELDESKVFDPMMTPGEINDVVSRGIRGNVCRELYGVSGGA